MITHDSRSSVLSVEAADLSLSSEHDSRRNGSAGREIFQADGDAYAGRTARNHTPKLREEIVQIREQVIMSRLDLRERRVEMREQHGFVRSLEAQILRHWQSNEAYDDQRSVTRLHGELCAALEQLGPMEEDYDEKEDELNMLEFDLEANQARFYRRYVRRRINKSLGSLSTDRSSISTLPEELDAKVADTQDLLSPQNQYYSRVGDAKIVRERLMELEAQRSQFLDIERERDALNIPSYQENTDFLINYDKEHAEHLEELERIEQEIHELGSRAGLVGPYDTTSTVAAPPIGDSLSEDKAESRQRSPFTDREQTGQSIPSAPEPPRRKSETDVWNVPHDPRSSRQRINQWILERLKDSQIERARHRAILNDPSLGPEAWWRLVLEFWQHDRAARSSTCSSRHASGASSSKRPQALQASLDLPQLQSSNGASSTEGGHIGANLKLPLTSFTWPEPVGRGDTAVPLDQLNYLDLAAGPSSTVKRASKKMGFDTGMLTA
ncbi:MAG: hypothetical protein LQ338_000499 [Usnochroma carphineum]|nr:MAG: hypothetical protein LQ338_000499 [Usnochroma carphineum]